ncbi:hypothetical protein OAT45_03525 [Alphaproteobacteria bacterium]|nr:hypothetical protein [Alphaproteobacteria bacterium]
MKIYTEEHPTSYQEWYAEFLIIFQEIVLIAGEDAVKEWAGWSENPGQFQELHDKTLAA